MTRAIFENGRPRIAVWILNRVVHRLVRTICRISWRWRPDGFFVPADERLLHRHSIPAGVEEVAERAAGFSQNRDQPVHIEAATLEVRDKDKTATFSGNVRVTQGDTGLRCKLLPVFYGSCLICG